MEKLFLLCKFKDGLLNVMMLVLMDYMLQVKKDKLNYYSKQEDAYGGQKPILSVPLPTVSVYCYMTNESKIS